MESTGRGEGAQGLDRLRAILWLGEALAGVPRHPGARPGGDWHGAEPGFVASERGRSEPCSVERLPAGGTLRTERAARRSL